MRFPWRKKDRKPSREADAAGERSERAEASLPEPSVDPKLRKKLKRLEKQDPNIYPLF